MMLDTGEQRRVVARPPAGPEPHRTIAMARRPKHNQRLILTLTLVIIAGFLLGLGVPIHP
jgi:hypothetical protein